MLYFEGMLANPQIKNNFIREIIKCFQNIQFWGFLRSPPNRASLPQPPKGRPIRQVHNPSPMYQDSCPIIFTISLILAI